MNMEYTNIQKISYMMNFTDIYASNSENIYLREARCIDYQLQYAMLPIRDSDLLAGRKIEFPIGFLPQIGYGVGYYCHEASLIEMKKDSSLNKNDIDALDYLLEFWKGKTTKEKIISAYTERQKKLMCLGDFTKESGVAFPLYRMSGAQMNPQKLLDKGICGLISQVKEMNKAKNSFYSAVEESLISLQKVCLRYHDMLLQSASDAFDEKRKSTLVKMADNFKHIANNKPNTFWQAMQLSYLFMLISGTFNYGRMDEYLGSYLKNDICNKIITEEQALELIKGLWSLIIERQNTWDARVILGGKDRADIEGSDQFAMLAMEASRQLKDTLPQLTLRCYKGMNDEVYNKALEVIGEGATYPMLYNDEVNIPSVMNAFKVNEETAQKYVPFGCGEFVLYNQSFGTPSGAMNLLHGLNTLLSDGILDACNDFSSFYNIYITKIKEHIEVLAEQEKLEYEICAKDAPFLYFSTLFDDCLKSGKAIFEGGIKYLGGTLELYGNTNTSDSLTAIKSLVFDQKLITPKQLREALAVNFEGYDEIRKLLLKAPKFGNDNEIADNIAVQLHNEICIAIRECSEKVQLHSYLGVVINNSMNTTFGLTTTASADGRLANSYMANANNPTGGMDQNGITAMLNSLVKLKTNFHAGSVQNMRFNKEMFTRLMDKTKQLLEVYFLNSGSQAMITVLNKGDLEKAIISPEEYQSLIVRVGGFSARFVELSKEVQQELLSRTLY